MNVIRIECTLEGMGKEHVEFKAEGWKYKHLRLWEEARSAGEVAAVVSERLVGWSFEPGFKATERPEEAFDELAPEAARWLASQAFVQAYRRAGNADPNG